MDYAEKAKQLSDDAAELQNIVKELLKIIDVQERSILKGSQNIQEAKLVVAEVPTTIPSKQSKTNISIGAAIGGAIVGSLTGGIIGLSLGGIIPMVTTGIVCGTIGMISGAFTAR